MKRLDADRRGEVSGDWDPNNLLDVGTPVDWRRFYEAHLLDREAALLEREGCFRHGSGQKLRVLSVGCGGDPRRGIPPGDFFVVGVDSSGAAIAAAEKAGTVDEVHLASASKLPFADESFDIVVFRLVLHHLIDQLPLHLVLSEARRVLRPGGRLVALEPNLYHPVGLLLFISNHLGWSKRIKGTSDDWPLSPRMLRQELESQDFRVRLVAVEFSWRRLPIGVQRALAVLEAFAEVPGLKHACHTFMLIGTKNGRIHTRSAWSVPCDENASITSSSSASGIFGGF
jgi:SAM-dependent methyltransferase